MSSKSPFNRSEMAKYLKAGRKPNKDNAPIQRDSGLVTLSEAFKKIHEAEDNSDKDNNEDKAEG